MPGVAMSVLGSAAETGEPRSAASSLLQGGGAYADVALQAPQVQAPTQNRCDVVGVDSRSGTLRMTALGMACSPALALLANFEIMLIVDLQIRIDVAAIETCLCDHLLRN